MKYVQLKLNPSKSYTKTMEKYSDDDSGSGSGTEDESDDGGENNKGLLLINF